MTHEVKLKEIRTNDIERETLAMLGRILGLEKATDTKGEIFMPHAIANRMLEQFVKVVRPLDAALATLDPVLVDGNSHGSAYNINEKGEHITEGRKGINIGAMRRVCPCGQAGCYVRTVAPYMSGLCRNEDGSRVMWEIEDVLSMPVWFSKTLIPDHHKTCKLNAIINGAMKVINATRRSGAGDNPNKPLRFRRNKDMRKRVKVEQPDGSFKTVRVGKQEWPALSAALVYHKTVGLYWMWVEESDAHNWGVTFDMPFNLTKTGAA